MYPLFNIVKSVVILGKKMLHEVKRIMSKMRIILLVALILSTLTSIISEAHAQGNVGLAEVNPIIVLSGALAFGMAAIAAGIGLAYVGAAAMAAIAENPKMRTSAFIFLGMVESIVIYGMVMLFIILGAAGIR